MRRRAGTSTAGQGKDDRDLVELQLKLEGVRIENGHLFEAVPGAEVPHVSLFRFAGEYVVYSRPTMEAVLTSTLTRLDPEVLFQFPGALVDAMGARGVLRLERFLVYTLASEDGPPMSGVIERDGSYVVEVGGTVVSVARSSRENEDAAELAVETTGDFRRRGYARQVSHAWASAVISRGKVAFFSHRPENLPSAGLALALGAKLRANGLHLY